MNRRKVHCARMPRARARLAPSVIALSFLASFAIMLAPGWLLAQRASGDDSPREVVARAASSVARGDWRSSASTWTAQLKKHPGDAEALLALATVARLTYDYPSARNRYARLIPPAGKKNRYAVEALLGRAHAASINERIVTAGAWYNRAALLAMELQDSTAAVEALTYAARMWLRTDGTSAADSILLVASKFLSNDGGASRIRHDCTRALVAIARNDSRGRQEAMKAAEAAGKAGLPVLRNTCLIATAQDYLRRGPVDSGLTILNSLMPYLRREHDRYSVGTALQWRGWSQRDIGRLGPAMNDLRSSIRENAAAGATNNLGYSYLDLGILHLRIGDTETAARHAVRARDLFRTTDDRWGEESALQTLGDVARSRGRIGDARQAYLRYLSASSRHGREGQAALAQTRLADLAMMERKWKPAREHLEEATKVAAKYRLAGWLRAVASLSAILALRTGDLVEAERHIDWLLTRPSAPLNRYRERAWRAELEMRKGKLEAAGAELGLAFDELDKARDRLSDAELRRSLFQVQAFWSDPDQGVASIISALARSGGAGVDAAFALAERRRARQLLYRLVESRALLVDDPPGRAKPIKTDPAAVSAERVRAAIPDDRTALLEYVTGRGGEPTTLFVVTRTAVKAYELPPIDSLAEQVRRFVALVQSGSGAPLIARQLGSALMRPALPALAGIRNLVIVPDDILHRVPFDALIADAGIPVLARYDISIVPSAEIAARLWGAPRTPRPASMLALGDPDFGMAVAATERSAFSPPGILRRLAGSGREARAVVRYSPAPQLRLSRAASESSLKQNRLDAYRVLHFATHAWADENSPARTALALSPGGGEDGFLTPAEAADLHIDADLVVVSACSSGSGVVVRGEGMLGLTSSFIEAGSRSVVASSWPIGDATTVRMMERLYSSLARGLTVSQALASAKREARAKGDPVNVWASFSVFGDGSVLVPVRKRGFWNVTVQ